jgi:hypothetical protein
MSIGKIALWVVLASVGLAACGSDKDGGDENDTGKKSNDERQDALPKGDVETTCGWTATIVALYWEDALGDQGCVPTDSHDEVASLGYVICESMHDGMTVSEQQRIDACAACYFPAFQDESHPEDGSCEAVCPPSTLDSLVEDLIIPTSEVTNEFLIAGERYSCD